MPRSRRRSRCSMRVAPSAATIAPSTVPATSQPARKARLAALRKTAPTRFANRGGRASSSGPSPKRGWTSSKYATHCRHQRRPSVRPTISWRASSARSHHGPTVTATSDRIPITAWLKRGARASITEVSRYGSAVRVMLRGYPSRSGSRAGSLPWGASHGSFPDGARLCSASSYFSSPPSALRLVTTSTRAVPGRSPAPRRRSSSPRRTRPTRPRRRLRPPLRRSRHSRRNGPRMAVTSSELTCHRRSTARRTARSGCIGRGTTSSFHPSSPTTRSSSPSSEAASTRSTPRRGSSSGPRTSAAAQPLHRPSGGVWSTRC